MDRNLGQLIRSIPSAAFREPEDGFTKLSPLERLRWLQQTALFVWKQGGAARRVAHAPPMKSG
ncbi:MAG: hypothetical protein ABI333_05830 [bacterium]